jgi:REP element-mobilizing transposase RayT
VPHRARDRGRAREPVHVLLEVLPGASGLRRAAPSAAIQRAIETCAERPDLAIVAYCVQDDELHVICEPRDMVALARGIQGFASVAARRINASLERSGKVFADRYASRVLRAPADLRDVVSAERGAWIAVAASRSASLRRAIASTAASAAARRGGRRAARAAPSRAPTR